MKYIAIIFAAIAISANARASMDDVQYTLTSIITNQASATYVVRGTIDAVNAVIPANKTATVTIVTASGVTIFSKAMTSATDGYFPILVPAYTTAGDAITTIINGSTNIVYRTLSVADSVTATVAPAANTTGTNTYTATLIVNK
jgi:hypothetical protein